MMDAIEGTDMLAEASKSFGRSVAGDRGEVYEQLPRPVGRAGAVKEAAKHVCLEL